VLPSMKQEHKEGYERKKKGRMEEMTKMKEGI
jgi:hypothetical protein